uniref:PSI-F n=1 Tax=Grammatophora oceanica TaxID=210454 RepID=A0A7S1UUM2_9STRA
MLSLRFFVLSCLSLTATTTSGFVAPSSSRTASVQSSSTSSSTLINVVKYDKTEEKWITTDPETEGPAAGYDIFGSLLRAGPKPVFVRIFQSENYEQAILKFMAGDKVGRLEAQANMDQFFENAQDWVYNRLQAEKGGYKPDYVTIKKDQIALRLVWSSVVFAFLGRAIYCYNTGDSFYAILSS